MKELRVLRLKSPRGPDKPPVYRALSIVDDRFVAFVYGGDLHVLDLHRGHEAPPVLVVEGGRNFVFVSDALLTFDATNGFRRFVREGDRFVEAHRFSLAGESEVWPTHLELSPSGRFLCFEVPAALGEKFERVILMDARTGAVLASHARHLSARASFSRIDGAEVLFLSAPSYMGVLLLDAATGGTLRSFEPTQSWDFCHTDYELSPDGERLLAFGCVWAAPYEVRLYDARPWTRGAAPAKDGFPLPLLYRQNEDLWYETVLPARFEQASDGTIDVLSLVSLRELHKISPDDARDLEEDLSPMNLEILEKAKQMRAEAAILQRRVDPRAGEVVSYRLAPIRSTRETQVFTLPEHQVILVNELVQYFDGEAIHDLAPFDGPKAWYGTALTRDGGLLVSRENEEG